MDSFKDMHILIKKYYEIKINCLATSQQKLQNTTLIIEKRCTR